MVFTHHLWIPGAPHGKIVQVNCLLSANLHLKSRIFPSTTCSLEVCKLKTWVWSIKVDFAGVLLLVACQWGVTGYIWVLPCD